MRILLTEIGFGHPWIRVMTPCFWSRSGSRSGSPVHEPKDVSTLRWWCFVLHLYGFNSKSYASSERITQSSEDRVYLRDYIWYVSLKLGHDIRKDEDGSTSDSSHASFTTITIYDKSYKHLEWRSFEYGCTEATNYSSHSIYEVETSYRLPTTENLAENSEIRGPTVGRAWRIL